MKILSARRWTWTLLSTLLAFSSSSWAGQLLEVRDGTSVPVRISGSEPNRILVRDGRIYKIWGGEGKAIIRPDGEKGEAYIQPTEQWKSRPFSIFIKDDLGAVYTLVLSPTDVPSENITLVRQDRPVSPAKRKKAIAWESQKPYEDTLLAIITQMAADGDAAEVDAENGYAKTTVNREVKLWNEAKLVLESRYVGGKLEGECYELTNVDTKRMRLDEREFYRDGVLAVAIDRHELQPGEKTKIYLVVGSGAK